MNTATVPNRVQPGNTPKPRFLDTTAKRALLARLAGLRHGMLTLVEGSEVHRFGRRTEPCPLDVTLHVHDRNFYTDVAFGGTIGAGEAYMQGHWGANDLTDLVRILIKNRAVLDGLETGPARLTAPLHKFLHRLHRNTHDGSRQNIEAHYDLGNDFFELFLDQRRMYSSAVFEHPRASLDAASLAKLDLICRKLALTPQDHVLEIGSGWGGFAIHAAEKYGCRVTTTTISRAQYEYTQRRVAENGLTNRITVLREDYRNLTGQYDKLVSIEMVEAVGREYLDAYFGKCSALLKADGQMLLQAITIADQRYEQASRSVDFIQRYIFPGSHIPSVAVMADSIARSTDMKLLQLEDIGPHYAKTLRHWRRRFLANRDKVTALGFSEAFIRMWEFYFCYCEGGFQERALGDVQMLLAKPDCRRASPVSSIG